MRDALKKINILRKRPKKRNKRGLYHLYASPRKSTLSDSIITFPFSFQLLDIDVYQLAHEFLEETLDLVFHFSLNDFCMNKTVGIPRVLDGPIHISTISVRPMLLRALSFP